MANAIPKAQQTRKSAAKEKKAANKEAGTKPAKIKVPRETVAMVTLRQVLDEKQLLKIDEILADTPFETGTAAELRIYLLAAPKKNALLKKVSESGDETLNYELYVSAGKVALRTVSKPRVKLVSL